MSSIATIHLRAVNINDAEILLDWRNDAITANIAIRQTLLVQNNTIDGYNL